MSTNCRVTIDHVKSFFSLGEELKPLDMAPTVTGGLGINNIDQFPPPKGDELVKKRIGAEYAKKYVREQELSELEEARSLGASYSSEQSLRSGGLESIEELSTAVGDLCNVNELDAEAAQERYAPYYKEEVHYSEDLPIINYKEKILQLVNINQVVILQGSTGCGKTTQVPQYILDDHVRRGHPCNIVVTQPRKIAAVSVARRVCQERKWQMGSIVGYQVAMDNKTSADTRIAYVTTGVLLQKLVNSRRMDMYTHVIIDEIHERDQDVDFALLVVKKLLRTNSKRVKVILMSATMDTSVFANYFSFPGRGDPAPILEVHGKSKEVTEHYLHELSALGIQIPVLDPDCPSIPQESYDLVVKLMFVFDKIEKAEQNVPTDKEYAPMRGAVLIFLPGYDEIGVMKNKLRAAAVSRKFSILPLHSSITIEEQTRVFQTPNPGFRKVIISTNIAESSITVPDIRYVIDFCLTKNLVCDPDTNYTCLQLEWAAKSNCIQRKGRAGRVDIGRVYRMVPLEFYERHLPEYSVPEMKRCPLEQTVLYTKKLNFGEPQALLALALDPPALSDIENSILLLKEARALALTVNGIFSPYDGDLTFVGQVMSTLPLDVKFSKLIIYGYVFNCLEETIIIAACLSLKSFFSKPFQNLLDSYKSKLSWADGTFSDCLAYLNSYQMWKKLSMQGQFRRPGGFREDAWAHQNFIQLPRIKETDRLVQELKNRLENLNIKVNYRRKKDDDYVETFILKMVIAGAFFPNYFCQEEIDEREAMKVINGADPFTTVAVSGLPANHGILYYNALRDMLSSCCPAMVIDFEERKAYIHFERRVFDQIDGGKSEKQNSSTILPSVYFAVKMRQMRIPFELQVFSHEDAEEKMEQYRKLERAGGSSSSSNMKVLSSKRMTVQSTAHQLTPPELPAINQLTVQIIITHMINCGHFWARNVDQETSNVLGLLKQTINMYKGKNLHTLSRVERGSLVLAPYSDTYEKVPSYYRATVETILSNHEAVVFYVDFGNTKCIKTEELRQIANEHFEAVWGVPALVFECQLSHVKPSAVRSPNFGWSKKANAWFSSLVIEKTQGHEGHQAKVYSVVQGIVRLELHVNHPTKGIMVINDELVKLGFAEPAEENLMSRLNYEARMKCEELSMKLPLEYDSSTTYFSPELLDFRDVRKTHHKIRIHGPFSPLEASYYGLTRLDRSKSVRIDQDSVNSVSLNPEPQEKYSQLLVACYVSVTPRGDILKARNTTLMPRIAGLQGLLCILFAPCAEYRTDPDRKAYTGALCGLGCDPNSGLPLYHEHDMEVAFETEIDYQDICEVNAIRSMVNTALADEEDRASLSERWLEQIQQNIRKALLKLVQKKRPLRDVYNYPKGYCWMQVPSQHLLDSVLDIPSSDENMQILPLHMGINLCDARSLKNEIKKQLEDLYDIANSFSHQGNYKCPVCAVILASGRELLLHLNTREHELNEKEFLLVKE